MSETVTRKLMLFFPKCECEKPIIYHLVKDYDIIVNVFRAKVTPEEEGFLVLDLTAPAEAIERALDYVRTFNVTISEHGKGVVWHSDRCVHCGGCVAHCPTGALHLGDAMERDIQFDEAQCIECLACIRVCGYNACTSVF